MERASEEEETTSTTHDHASNPFLFSDMPLSNPPQTADVIRPVLARSASNYPNDFPSSPLAATSVQNESKLVDAVLELADGTTVRGISFGAEAKSVSGECVFQTGVYFLPSPMSYGRAF